MALLPTHGINHTLIAHFSSEFVTRAPQVAKGDSRRWTMYLGHFRSDTLPEEFARALGVECTTEMCSEWNMSTSGFCELAESAARMKLWKKLLHPTTWDFGTSSALLFRLH